MNEKPKRRLLDQIGSTPTFIAAGCRITGDLETPGPLVVVIPKEPAENLFDLSAEGAAAMMATTVDDEEPQLLSQEITNERVASIDEALAVIKKGVTGTSVRS